MRATTGRISARGRNSISARFWRVLEMILDLLDEQAPGLVLTWACGLLHRDLQIAKLALDLFARQHVQAAGQDCRFDHRGLRAVEALERSMRGLEHHLAIEARTLLILFHIVDLQLG